MELAQLLVDGVVPVSVFLLLSICSLTPLAKPLPKGGIRPLAVGEVLRRFMARSICLQYRRKFEEDLSPHQFAVAKSSGVEVVHKSVGILASAHSVFVWLLLILVTPTTAFTEGLVCALFVVLDQNCKLSSQLSIADVAPIGFGAVTGSGTSLLPMRALQLQHSGEPGGGDRLAAFLWRPYS